MERIPACFGKGTREKVRGYLERGERLDDFFVLCKVVRRYLRRVFRVESSRPGKPMEDFRLTEYLNWVVECVETTRHRAFHGAGISPAEVASSLSYSARIVSLLAQTSDACEGTDMQLTITLDRLETLQKENSELVQGRKDKVWVSASEEEDVLLRRCFTYLEIDLRRLLESALPDEYKAMTGRRTGFNNLNALLEFLKRSCSRRRLRSRQTCGVSVDDIQSACCAVRNLRNNLAHTSVRACAEERGKVQTVKRQFSKAANLWKAFGFYPGHLENVLNYQQTLSCSRRTKSGGFVSVSSAALLATRAHEAVSGPCIADALHLTPPAWGKSIAFVGREKELQESFDFLTRSSAPVHVHSEGKKRSGQLMVISGVSGVGKTSLAGMVLDQLSSQIPRQLWLCASTDDIFAAELQTHLPLHSENSGEKHERRDVVFVASKASTVFRTLPRHLIVLDDVTEDMASLVEMAFSGTIHSVVITTCCSHTQSFTRITELFAEVHHIQLSNLDTIASLRLVKERGIPLIGNDGRLCHILEKDLENLPLAVNMFCSLMQCKLVEKKKKSANESETNHQRPEGKRLFRTQEMVTSILESIEFSLDKNLVKFSCQSTESPHIRGIAGLANIAMERLVEEPPALCLVFILTLVGPHTFPLYSLEPPWSVQSGCQSLGVTDDSKISRVDEACLVSAAQALLGPDGQVRHSALQLLISLGLVTWHAESQMISMHQLLQCYFRMFIFEDASCYSRWVDVEPKMLQYVLCITIVEHLLLTGPYMFEIHRTRIATEQKGKRKKCFAQALVSSPLGKMFQSIYHILCPGFDSTPLPRHLSWVLPGAVLLTFRNIDSRCLQRDQSNSYVMPKEAIIKTARNGAWAFFNKHGRTMAGFVFWALRRYGYINDFGCSTFPLYDALGHWVLPYFKGKMPCIGPPFNLFYAIGVPNLVWQRAVSQRTQASQHMSFG